MGEAVQQGGRQLFVAGKHRDPFGKREIRCHHRGPPFVPIRDQIEEQLAADPVEGDEAQFVDDEDVDAQETLLQARELARITGFEQLADEIGRPGEEHAPFLFGRFDAKGDRQVCLPRAGRTSNMMPIILRRCACCIGGTPSSAKSYRSPVANTTAPATTSSVDFLTTRSASSRRGCSIRPTRTHSALR
jgi:hypothetical protein